MVKSQLGGVRANGIVLACIFYVFGLQTLPTCSIHRPQITINFEVWSVFCVYSPVSYWVLMYRELSSLCILCGVTSSVDGSKVG